MYSLISGMAMACSTADLCVSSVVERRIGNSLRAPLRAARHSRSEEGEVLAAILAECAAKGVVATQQNKPKLKSQVYS
jgi:plasmid stability protein